MADSPAGSFRAACSSPARLRQEVFGGLAVSLALIPEVLSFSILAGLDPLVAAGPVAQRLETEHSRPQHPRDPDRVAWPRPRARGQLRAARG
mgnify:CR=1 FL=1